MPGEVKEHIVVCKGKDDLVPAKEFATQQGGEIVEGKDITTVYTGFSVKLPVDSVSAFQSSPHIASIEEDKGVSIQ